MDKYSVLFLIFGFYVAHIILAYTLGPLDIRFFYAAALCNILIFSILAIIDYSGFSWRWPLSKRVDNDN